MPHTVSSPENDRRDSARNSMGGLRESNGMFDIERDVVEKDRLFPDNNYNYNNNTNKGNDSILSRGTKEMNWPSIFDKTDILILKRCFQRCDYNEPDLNNNNLYNNKANSRHNNRCIPPTMELEEKCTNEAFQNFVNDYIARFMPQEDLKKFIDKSP